MSLMDAIVLDRPVRRHTVCGCGRAWGLQQDWILMQKGSLLGLCTNWQCVR